VAVAGSRMAGSRLWCWRRTGQDGRYHTQKDYCETFVASPHGSILDVTKSEMVYAPALLKRFEKPSKHYEVKRTILLQEFCIVPKRDSDPLLAYPGLAPWAKICRRSAAGVCCNSERDVIQLEPASARKAGEGARPTPAHPAPPAPHGSFH
jgi:hypothetical protein